MAETKFTKVNDSGARQEFSTGSVRDLADGKGRYDLIPTYPLQRLAEHYENGAKKYGDRNWEKGQPLMRYLDSMLRHAIKGLLAGDKSEDHASAVVWNMFSYMHTLNEIEHGRLPKELDNRPPRMTEKEAMAKVAEIRSAGEMKYANLKHGYVAHISAWQKGGCAWCGNITRDGLLYTCRRCEDKIVDRDYPGSLFGDLVKACDASVKS